MAHVPGRAVLAILAVAVLLACGAPVALAHDGRPATSVAAPVAPAQPAPPVAVDIAPRHTISPSPSVTVVPLVLLATLAVGASLTLVRAPRRVVAFAVVPLLVLVMFETGVHGVHHLGDPRAAAQCSVAVSAEHVTGAVVDVPADVAPLAFVSAPVVLPDAPPSIARQYRPGDGRAPPAPSA